MTISDHEPSIDGLKPDCENLDVMLANIITSRHNQHAIIMVVGSAGKGKSWAAISLARGVAERVAEILGGAPEDYFNFKDNFATINKEQVKRVMNKPKKHAILVIDDAAADAMNARKYKDKDNIDFNSEITTFRPNHNLLILTTQAGFLIDKVPRSLCHFIIEMEQAYFDYGITVAKVKQVQYINSTQKLHFPYMQAGASKYVRHIFRAPPKEITDAYEIERDIQQKAMKKEEDKQEQTRELTLRDRFTSEGLLRLYNDLGSWSKVGKQVSRILGTEVTGEGCRVAARQ